MIYKFYIKSKSKKKRYFEKDFYFEYYIFIFSHEINNPEDNLLKT